MGAFLHMNIYKLIRSFWDWAFENPDLIKPNHAALYFFAVEHCNRLGWKEKFGLPTTMAMEAIGIRSYNTYKKTLDELVGFGFIDMIETSKNQYSSNIVALSNFDESLNKALDKALMKHTSKQSESTRQSNSSIDIPITSLQKYNIDNVTDKDVFDYITQEGYMMDLIKDLRLNKEVRRSPESLNPWVDKFIIHLKGQNIFEKQKMDDYRTHFANWYKLQLKNV